MSKDYVIHQKFMPAASNPFWDWDTSGKLHMTFKLKLDHEINGDMLLDALKETYDVWPVLKDALIVDSDGILCFAENPEPIKVHNSPSVVSPGAGLNADRPAAVTYYGDTLYVTGMHTFFDGGSAMMILKDMTSRYLKKYYGDDLDVGTLPQAGEGDKPEYMKFYAANERIAALPFEYKEPVERPKEVFVDNDMDYGPDLALARCLIECPNDEFIAFCKKNGMNPSVMLFVLFAKAVHKLNPDNDLPITANNTMNIRHALGLDMSIMGQTMGNLQCVKHEDMELPLDELGKKLRAAFDAQRDMNFILSRVDDMKNGIGSLAFKLSASLQYMGSIKYGDGNKHIKDFTMYGDLHQNIIGYELNGTFSIGLLLGAVSRKYAETILDMLKSSGVNAAISEYTEALPAEIH